MSRRKNPQAGPSQEGPPPRQRRKSTQPPPSQPSPADLFIDSNALNLFRTSYSSKSVITGRPVTYRDFGEFQLQALFTEVGWQDFITIREPVYPRLVRLFYANLSISDNVLSSYVLGREITLSRTQFAAALGIPDSGIENVYYRSLVDFEYPQGHSVGAASTMLHGDNNVAWYTNTEVKHYTPIAQLIARIASLDIVPKKGEYSSARGSTPLIVYCIMAHIRLNLPKLMFDHMTCPELTRRSLPYGMALTRIFKFCRIIPPTSEEVISRIIPLDRGFISRQRGQVHAVEIDSDDEEDQQEEQQQDAPPSAAAAGPSVRGPPPTTYDIMRRLDEMTIRQQQMCLTQFEMSAALRYEHDRMTDYFSFVAYQEVPRQPTQFSHPLPPIGPPFEHFQEPSQGDDADDDDNDGGDNQE